MEMGEGGLLWIAERDAILKRSKWRAAIFERDDVTSKILFADSTDDGYKAPASFSWDAMTAVRMSHLRGNSDSTHIQHMPLCGGCFLIRICERWSSIAVMQKNCKHTMHSDFCMYSR